MGKYNSLTYLKRTKARTSHQCNYCGSIISPQEYYFRETMQDKFLQSLHARIFCSKCYEKYGETLVKMKKDAISKAIPRRLSSYFRMEKEDEEKS
jgi:hypothetical protein